MMRVAIVTVSDSAVAGTREDRSGPALSARIAELGWRVAKIEIVPDDVAAISKILTSLDADVIVTTGGTGIAPRDVTPEAVRSVADKEIPGFGEIMRAEGRKKV